MIPAKRLWWFASGLCLSPIRTTELTRRKGGYLRLIKLPRKPSTSGDFADRKWLKWVADLLTILCDRFEPVPGTQLCRFVDDSDGLRQHFVRKLSAVLEDHNNQYFDSNSVKGAMHTIQGITRKSFAAIVGHILDSMGREPEMGRDYVLADFVEAARQAIPVLNGNSRMTLRERATQMGLRSQSETPNARAETTFEEKPDAPVDPEGPTMTESQDWPDWLVQVAIQVDELVGEPVIREVFERRLRDWKAEQDKAGPSSPVNKHGHSRHNSVEILPRRRLSLAAKYAATAAIHDVICEKTKRIDPWRTHKQGEFARRMAGIVYTVLESKVYGLTDRDRPRIERTLAEVKEDSKHAALNVPSTKTEAGRDRSARASSGEQKKPRRRRSTPKKIEQMGKASAAEQAILREIESDTGRTLSDILQKEGERTTEDVFRKSKHFKDARQAWKTLKDRRKAASGDRGSEHDSKAEQIAELMEEWNLDDHQGPIDPKNVAKEVGMNAGQVEGIMHSLKKERGINIVIRDS